MNKKYIVRDVATDVVKNIVLCESCASSLKSKNVRDKIEITGLSSSSDRCTYCGSSG